MKKAVYYERVSTLNNEQTNSLENQRKLCEEFLAKHNDIVLAEPIDSYSERVSGKSDLRDKYIEMITRVSKGDIDYILVKDLKRLSRSAEVSAQIRNQCKKYGVKLILLSNGQIYDPNEDGNRMLYGFEALMNEEVVYRQSEYGRIAHRQKMEAKRLSSQNCTFGYRWDKEKNDMIICHEEAEVICRLFELLVFKDYGAKELREFLVNEKGICVSNVTVRNWLHETAYIGTFHMNKKGSILGVGSGQKTKHYRKPKEEWVAVDRPDLAIVNPKLFDLAQKIMDSRTRVYDADKNGLLQARFKGHHLFSSKVFCSECGKSFVHCWADRNNTVGVYRDSFVQKRRDASALCENKKYSRIYEDELELIVRKAINTFISKHTECFEHVLQALKTSLMKETTVDSDNKLKQLGRLKQEAEKILQAYMEASGPIREALSKKYEAITEQITKMKGEISELDRRKIQGDVLVQKMQVISKELDKLKEIKVLDRSIVENFVDKILISKDGKIEIVLKVNEICIAQIQTWQEQKEKKQTQRKSESAFSLDVYVENEWSEVSVYPVKMESPGMRDPYQQRMQIQRKICCPAWKQWC